MFDFASAWEQVVDAIPDNEAVVFGDRRITYREFDDGAARFAGALETAGVPEGAKVALYLYNCPEYLIAQYGSFKHRAVPVNVNYRYLDDELVYLLENSDAEALVFHSSLSTCVERVRDKLTTVGSSLRSTTVVPTSKVPALRPPSRLARAAIAQDPAT